MTEFVNSAGSVLSLVALLVAAIAVAYSALTRTTIATLKESNAAQDERIKILEAESTRDKAASVRDKATIEALQSERDTLARVVTGEAHLVAIEDQLQHHHTDAQVWWTGATEVLNAIRALLERPA